MIYKNIDINMNAKEIEFLKSVQTTELNIMDIVHQVCIKNNIEYGLFWGSLIGAIRHQGFIPWDDDIDIAMTSTNYLKFKALLNNNSKIILVDYETKNWNRAINKVYLKKRLLNKGKKHFEEIPFIDIFIINKAPKNPKHIKKTFYYMTFFWNLSSMWSQKTFLLIPGIRKTIIKKIYNYIFKRDQMIKSENYDNVYLPCDPYAFKKQEPKLYNKNWFNKGTKLITFENRQYCIFKYSENFLTEYYINFLKLPPFKDRQSHHFIK